jgi:uncharacterized protein (DUF433 family)
MDALVEKSHIESTPGTCGGAPRIAGTRIRVSQIVLLHEAGSSPDQIVTSYPHLKLADVYAALAYYHDHREAIDAEIRQDEAIYTQTSKIFTQRR